jgi:phage-related protein
MDEPTSHSVRNFIDSKGQDPVKNAIKKLKPHMQNRVINLIRHIAKHGLNCKKPLLIRKVSPKIHVLIIDDFRILFVVTWDSQEMRLMHAYSKKRKVSELNEIKLAEKRLNELDI